jgi:hypothetical protein
MVFIRFPLLQLRLLLRGVFARWGVTTASIPQRKFQMQTQKAILSTTQLMVRFSLARDTMWPCHN